LFKNISKNIARSLLLSLSIFSANAESTLKIKDDTVLEIKEDKGKDKDMNKTSHELDLYILELTKLNKFSGSVLVAKDNKILLSKSYGSANYELNVPNTPQTKFRIGSITKPFTAIAIMQLQDKGLLNVTDTLNKYIPDYPNGNEITIHHLLTHTSGIPSFTGFADFDKTVSVLPNTLEKLIESFKNKNLEFKPGEKFNYNNSGYVLLTYIIEKVSGKSYEEFIKENILIPANMTDTGVDNNDKIVKNRAAGYSFNDNQTINAAYTDMSWPRGAGNLYSTIEDLYKFDRALYTENLLKQDSYKLMHTPFINDYCYGWGTKKICDHVFFGHGGGISGFLASFIRFPDNNICIIILSNYEFAPIEEMTVALSSIIFGCPYEFPKERIEIKVDTKIYDDYVGEYELNPEFHIKIFKENNRLFTLASGQPKFEIYPEDTDLFFLKVANAQIKFIRDKENKVTELIIKQNGEKIAKKIK